MYLCLKLGVQYIERHTESLDWVILLLVTCLVLFVVAKQLYPKRFNEFILIPATNKYFFTQGRNENIYHPFNLILFSAQVISVSLFIYLLIKSYRPEYMNSNPWIFTHIITGYVVFVSMKIALEKIIGSIFSIDVLINSYLFQKLNYRNLLGIVFIIGNLSFFYMVDPPTIALTIFVIIILCLNAITLLYCYKRNARAILPNFFYFILYLCALEIAPYVILYQLVE